MTQDKMSASETPEFQAVIMAAGKGSRMTDLTAGRPKCLLPIGNKPMVWYPLQLLERNGFNEVILIVQETSKAEIQTALDRQGLKIHIDIVGIPSTEDWGTADSLRFVAKKILTNVVILSCDLLTDYRLRDALDLFRVHQASVAAVFFRANEFTGVVPGPKTKSKPEQDIIGIEPSTKRLVYCRSASDLKDTLPIRKKLLRKHLRVMFHSRLTDAHLYVFSKWLVEMIAADTSFGALKGELLPFVVKHQLGRPKAAKAKSRRSERADSDSDSSSEPEAEVKPTQPTQPVKDIVDFATESALDLKVRNLSLFTDNKRDLRPPYLADPYRCYGLVADVGCIGARINTLAAFCQANAKLSEWWPLVTGGRPAAAVHAEATVASTQLAADCFVAERASLAERTSFSASTVGAACDVRQKVRVDGCVLIGQVTVREGCVLTNCVVADGAVIEENVKLTACVVGANFVVPAGSKHANETLTELEDLMEI